MQAWQQLLVSQLQLQRLTNLYDYRYILCHGDGVGLTIQDLLASVDTVQHSRHRSDA